MITSVLIVITAFLLLTILGTMREVAILRGDVKALERLLIEPPDPTDLGLRAPEDVQELLPEGHDDCGLVFVSANCNGCVALMEEFRRSSHSMAKGRLVAVIAPSDKAQQLASQWNQLGVKAVVDSANRVSKALQIHSTPTAFIFNGPQDERVLNDYKVGPDVDWVVSRVAQHLPVLRRGDS